MAENWDAPDEEVWHLGIDGWIRYGEIIGPDWQIAGDPACYRLWRDVPAERVGTPCLAPECLRSPHAMWQWCRRCQRPAHCFSNVTLGERRAHRYGCPKCCAGAHAASGCRALHPKA